jgi:NAD(P)H-hydrate epimerase
MAMLQTITPEAMRQLETNFFERTGMPELLLMERAALALQPFLKGAARALFLCGPGKNGGDGLAAARQYAAEGGEPVVWLTAKPDALPRPARKNAALLEAMDIPVRVVTDALPLPAGVDMIVDALLGTGLSRAPEGLLAALIQSMNAAGKPILAVDIPSGVDGATGKALGPAVQARWTVTFHRPKPGHYLYPGRLHTGALTVASLGIPAVLDGAAGCFILEDADVLDWLPARAPDAHKGDFGHVLCVAGSLGMAGAAALCAQAALRGGAGLVTVACPEAVLPTVQALVPCAMAKPFETARDLKEALSGKRAVAVGPGLSSDPSKAGALMEKLAPLFDNYMPQVWDADGLNLLAASGRTPPPNAVLTPHPGEAARLMGVSVEEITADPLEAARALSRKAGAVVLLKGATTAVADGEQTALNLSGCNALAKGGSGDVLTGLLTALLAQGLPRFKAAVLAAFLHGRAGDAAARQMGASAVTAWDLPSHFVSAPHTLSM